MGESHTLFRLAIFIGFVLLFSSMAAQPWVFVGQPLPPDSTWGQFQTGIQNFPTFNNPFDTLQVVSTYIFPPAAPEHGALVPNWETTELTGCTVNWQCTWDVNGSDGARSYATIHGRALGFANFTQMARTRISMDLAGSNLYGQVLTQYSVDIVCRTRNSTIPLEISAPPIVQWMGASYSAIALTRNHAPCPIGLFRQVSMKVGNISGDTSTTDFALSTYIERFNATNDDSPVIDVSFVRFQAIYKPTSGAGCSGGDFFSNIGCQLGQLGDTIAKFFQYILNGIIFIFSVIAWFIGMIGIFFSSLTSILNVPGAPPIITGIIGILIIGSLFFVAIVIMGKIRGVGNTG